MDEREIIFYIVTISIGFFVISGFAIYIAVLFYKSRLKRQSELFEAMISSQENEQRRIGIELHDSISPLLSSIKFKIDLIHNRIKNNTAISEKEFETLEEMLDHSAAVARQTAHNLMPVALQKGYLYALQQYIINLRHPHINIILYERNFPAGLSHIAELNLYRIVQELVHNAIKHAKASYIKIYLFSFEPHVSQLIIKDNGTWRRGATAEGLGMGQFNIRHRVKWLKGCCSFYQNKPSGLAVHLKFDSRKWPKKTQ